MMIETKRLRLRAVEEGDLAHIHRWWNDRRVQRFQTLHRQPVSLAVTERWYRDAGNDPRQLRLLIEEKESGRPIGTIDLFDIRPPDGVAELAIMIGDVEAWGQGFGPEAVGAMLDLAFNHLGLRKTLLRAMAYSQGAIDAYQGQGFVVEGTLRQQVFWDGDYHDQILLGVLREELQPRGPEPGDEETSFVIATPADLEEMQTQMREEIDRIQRSLTEGA
jgi:RimJ/RimL family protein N-acetyltransferase